MVRSFTDRVFGGVCGGLGAALRIPPWLLRAAWVVFTLVSLGTGAVLYATLWWAMPLESLVDDRPFDLVSLLLVISSAVVLIGGWALHVSGQLTVLAGREVFVPVVLMTACTVFLLRQIGGRA